MSPVAGTFLAIGGFALLLLALSLLGARFHLGHLPVGHLHIGHLHIGHLGHVHIGHLGHVQVSHLGHVQVSHLGHVQVGHLGHVQVGHQGGAAGGTELSLPVIAGFLGAFGFGGAIVASVLPGRGVVTLLAAAVVGLLTAIPTGWLTGRLVRAAMNMRTDGTPTSNDLVGAMGLVITPVRAGGYGEVRLALAGQHMKFNARSDQPLALGTRIFVISALSPTSVLVERTPAIQLGSGEKEGQ
jgi:membrane protein implicated in regulation of membrane protease activity